MDRRNFLKALGVGVAGAGLALHEATQVNRVYFFPKEIKLYKPEDIDQLVVRHFRYDVSAEQIHAAERGEVSWESLSGEIREYNGTPTPFPGWPNNPRDNPHWPKQYDNAYLLKRKPFETFAERKIVLTDF